MGLTRKHEELFTASENDVLRDTDLRQAPGIGAIGFWLASDQNDSSFTIRVGGVSLANRIIMPNKGTNAPIDEGSNAPAATVMVQGGELIQVDIIEVTAANMRLVAVWVGG